MSVWNDLVPPARAKTVHGVSIGIMMLDTGFQRIDGDIGYAPTWDFPVHYKIVRGAVGERVLADGGGGTLDLFIAAANELADFGVDGIVTSCGFLARFQKELTRRCPVPVASSSLLQIPMVEALLPKGRRVGVLTADKAALTADHFEAVNCSPDVPVVGMPVGGVFKTDFRKPSVVVDRARQEEEVMGMAAELIRDHAGIGAIVCECTNLAPYSAKIASTFGLPVFDVVTLVNWFHSGLRPRRFGAN